MLQELIERFKALERPTQAEYHLDKKLRWPSYHKAVTKIKETVTFPCNWHDGKCEAQRINPEYYTKAACCNGCYHSTGYLDAIEPGTAEKYANLFIAKFGFWREGSGCVLPATMRSPICIRYFCGAGQTIDRDYWKNSPGTQATKIFRLHQIKKAS